MKEYIEQLMQNPRYKKALREIDAVCAVKMKNYDSNRVVVLSSESRAELVAEMREDDLRYARGLSAGLSKVIS